MNLADTMALNQFVVKETGVVSLNAQMANVHKQYSLS